MVTTDTGAKKISNNENWRNIFDAHNDSVDAYDDHIAKLDSGLAYVAVQSGNDWMLPSGKNASSGDYVIVNKVFGHATATLTGGSTAIVENTNWVAESAGALNSLNSKLTVEDISSTITQDTSKIGSGGVYVFRYGKIIEVIINFYPQSGVQAGDIIATGLPLSIATFSSRFGVGTNGVGFDVDYNGNLRITGTVVIDWTQSSIVYLER